MVKLVALCTDGLENITLEEIKSIGSVENIEHYEGILLFEYKGACEKLQHLKTVDDILIFVKKFTGISRYKASLRKFRHQAAKANFLKAVEDCKKIRIIKEKIEFSVNASYDGRRDYTSSEIEMAVSESITKHYAWQHMKEGIGDVHIDVIITPKISFCGISLDEKPLHIRNKLITVPGSLRNSIASSLLKIAKLDKNEVFLDPMCGSGVIAIEAALLGGKAIAGDIDEHRLKVAKENSDSKKANVELHLWDARNTGLLENSIDKLVSNLPFDKQVKLEYDNEKFFDEFINEMIRISKKGSRYIFLTRHGDLLKLIIKKRPELKFEKSVRIVNSGLELEILIVDKIG